MENDFEIKVGGIYSGNELKFFICNNPTFAVENLNGIDLVNDMYLPIKHRVNSIKEKMFTYVRTYTLSAQQFTVIETEIVR